tara:strand:- start:1340 stop:2257 length:918 start_codon:yes stop_codon:yes gene_type:complete
MTVRENVNSIEEEYEDDNKEPTPYENSYRTTLDEPDETEEDYDEDPVEATPKRREGMVDNKRNQDAEKHDFKKRYGDLKKHYDEKLNEWKQQQELLEAKLRMVETSQQVPALPKTEQDLEEFREKYPDVYDTIETISTLRANEQVREIETHLEELRTKEHEAIVKTAEQELISLHPEFSELKESDHFLNWLDEQPSNISDGIYKNNTDVKWAARVVDLYKSDHGITSKTRSTAKKSKSKPTATNQRNDAASSVTRTNKRVYLEDLQNDGKVWTVDEIRRLKPHEFAKFEKDIDKASKEGRIVDAI